jgi:hypothetical protein
MKKELSLREKALAAMRDAIARVIEEHRRSGEPLAVWRDGKVVLIPPPGPMTVGEEPSRYEQNQRARRAR